MRASNSTRWVQVSLPKVFKVHHWEQLFVGFVLIGGGELGMANSWLGLESPNSQQFSPLSVNMPTVASLTWSPWKHS